MQAERARLRVTWCLLHANRARSHRVVGRGRRSARRKRKNFETSASGSRSVALKWMLTENGIPRGIGNLRTNFEWDKVIASRVIITRSPFACKSVRKVLATSRRSPFQSHNG